MDKATELAKIIAWARANGVTPELRVKTTTTTGVHTLLEEGREERLASLRPLLPSPFEVVS